MCQPIWGPPLVRSHSTQSPRAGIALTRTISSFASLLLLYARYPYLIMRPHLAHALQDQSLSACTVVIGNVRVRLMWWSPSGWVWHPVLHVLQHMSSRHRFAIGP